MKTFMFIALSIGMVMCQAQEKSSTGYSEFQIHENGLIYDEVTMSHLEKIVDSLNLKFKSCEPKTFYALPQGYATHVVISEKDVKNAKRAMRNDMPFEIFLKEFPNATVERRHWIYVYDYTDYKDEHFITYSTLPLPGGNRVRIDVKNKPGNKRSQGWVFEEEDDQRGAFYLENVAPAPIPQAYARLVQYVDCMIDTSAEIYLTKERDHTYSAREPGSKVAAYVKMANDFKKEPRMPKIEWDSPGAEAAYEKFDSAYGQWNTERLAALDQKMKSERNRDLLRAALNEALENKVGDAQLEFYVAKYLSPEDALYLKRLRRPVGGCSQDRTPRIHAAEICKLAAQTAKWDIFLRAHLDIMNDNFSRVTDGSYAWAGRGTYLKELEMLDINAVDLLIGISLRSGSVNKNHYFGDVSRIGRALSECQDLDALEQRLLTMIKDDQLDAFNRLLMAYLFGHHNYYLKDEVRKNNNHALLKEAVATLPDDIGKTFEKE